MIKALFFIELWFDVDLLLFLIFSYFDDTKLSFHVDDFFFGLDGCGCCLKEKRVKWKRKREKSDGGGGEEEEEELEERFRGVRGVRKVRKVRGKVAGDRGVNSIVYSHRARVFIFIFMIVFVFVTSRGRGWAGREDDETDEQDDDTEGKEELGKR